MVTGFPDVLAALGTLQRAVDLALSRGCSHCSESIMLARRDAPRALSEVDEYVKSGLAQFPPTPIYGRHGIAVSVGGDRSTGFRVMLTSAPQRWVKAPLDLSDRETAIHMLVDALGLLVGTGGVVAKDRDMEVS